MSAWVGPLGSLVEFAKYKGSLSVAPGDRSTLRRTLGGQVFEQRGPRGRRSWSVESSASPAEAARFEALVDGFYGPPPWVWVDPSSRVTNLFSPGGSMVGSGTWGGVSATTGGAGTTADGFPFGRSVNIPASNILYLGRRESVDDFMPVLPSVPVTGSFYATGNAQVRLEFFTSTGGFISSTLGPVASGTWDRSVVTATPPANAASARLSTAGATSVTLPAFTWTDGVQSWAKGRGATRVTVDGVSEGIQVVSTSGSWSSFSFTVRELG